MSKTMTDAECAETLAEFRLLTLGPRLSEALDHAIGRLRPTPLLAGDGFPQTLVRGVFSEVA